MDSAFGEFLKEVTWGEFLVAEMLELGLLVSDELQVKRTDFKDELNSFGPKSEECGIIISASEPPVLVRIVSASRLEESHWGKLHGRKLDLASGLLELEISTNERMVPALLLLVPNGDLDLTCILFSEDRFRKCELHIDWLLNSSGTCWVRERNVL